MTDTTPLTFVDPMKRETIVNFGGTIPTMATPKNGSSSLEVLYKTPKGFIQQSSTLMAPPLSTYYGKIQKGTIPSPTQPPPDPTTLPAQVSNGGTYIAPSGATVQVPPNVAVPADWSPTTVPITSGTANNIIVAPDSTQAGAQQTQQYIVPGADKAINIPTDVPVPSNWTPINTGISDLVPQSSTPAGQIMLSPGGTYLTPSGNIYKLPPLAPVPPGWTLVPSQLTSTGTVWTTAGGGTVFALPGSEIPSTWLPSPVAYDSSKAILIQNNVSLSPEGGGWYSDLQGNPTFVPGGIPVPVGWRTTYAPTNSTIGTGIDPAFDPSKAQGNAPPTTKTYFADTVSMVLGVIGMAGVGYIGYLFVTNPAAIRVYVEDLSKVKDLAIDVAAIAAAIAFLAGISFFNYEFFKAYEDTGSVAGALGQLTADTITIIVETIVTAAETLLKDLFNSVSSGVSTVIKEI